MTNGRRGFFKKVGLGLAAGVMATNMQADEKPKEGFYNKTLPYDNPTDELIMDHDEAMKFIAYDVEHKIISVSKPMSIQTLYSATKWKWKEDGVLLRYEFPLLGIHPEMFELQNEWTFDQTSFNNLRNAGLGYNTYDNDITSEGYASIIVLSQQGMVFDMEGKSIPNGSMLPIKNGKVQGFYQYSKGTGFISLHEHLGSIGVTGDVSYQCYRIV